MESAKLDEEKLREAACYGDLEAIKTLLKKGVNINSQHSINGWYDKRFLKFLLTTVNTFIQNLGQHCIGLQKEINLMLLIAYFQMELRKI